MLGGLCAAAWCAGGSGITCVAAAEPVEFLQDIRPILNRHCAECHGGVQQAGGVSFVYRDRALGTGDSGEPIVVPGQPQASLLVHRVTSPDESDRMPPVEEHREALSAEEQDLLQRWIAEGAEWSEHWSFVPPQKQPVPSLRESGWCRQPVDHFILARLEAAGIRPSDPAPADRWLRRVTLDLIGLPPTLEEREEFLSAVARDGEPAYAAVVDRLLSSPRFGERWASVWLDLVRYADSKGLGQDGRRTIWKYRDWVIDAFNRDLPYDRFTVMQLAGDLLPDPTMEDLIATACHRATQSNEEGGTDDEEFRIEAVIDRVNTTWQAWQGLTFGCVQCHNHPYDALRHDEYYQFLAFFNNTADCDLNSDAPVVSPPIEPGDYPKARQLDREMERIQARLWEAGEVLLQEDEVWSPLANMTARTDNSTRVTVDSNADGAEYRTEGTVEKGVTIVLEAPLGSGGESDGASRDERETEERPEVAAGNVAVDPGLSMMTALRFTALPVKPDVALRDSEWGFVLSHFKAELIAPGAEGAEELALAEVAADELHPILDPQLSLNAKSEDGFAAYTRIHHARRAAFILQEPHVIRPGSRIRVSLRFAQDANGAFPLVARRGRIDVTDDRRLTELLSGESAVALRKELSQLQQARKSIPSTTVPVMQDRPPAFARPTHVFTRGSFLTKADAVLPDTPDSLPPLPAERPRNRLSMAEWLVSPENPLTARVAVNRFWGQLFGLGLVETQEDFGSTGDAPTHPDLLDDLAVRFQTDMQWSVKSLLRELTLSATYRQTNEVTRELLKADPRNRLLARGPRHRLPAETVRDQALALGGILSERMAGPPTHPPLPEGVWTPFQAGDKWETPAAADPDRFRRSVYTYTKRTIPYPIFETFDAPSRESCAARRLLSNTPLQALTLLNDASFAEAARGLAAQMEAASPTVPDQVRHGMLRATCREAARDEVDELTALYNRVCTGATSPRQALTIVASVLLNLDEVLVK